MALGTSNIYLVWKLWEPLHWRTREQFKMLSMHCNQVWITALFCANIILSHKINEIAILRYQGVPQKPKVKYSQSKAKYVNLNCKSVFGKPLIASLHVYFRGPTQKLKCIQFCAFLFKFLLMSLCQFASACQIINCFWDHLYAETDWASKDICKSNWLG